MKPRSFPLGIDVGTTRLRVAHTVEGENGPVLRAVAVREIGSDGVSSGFIHNPEYVTSLLEDAVAELSVRERRCVLAMSEPDCVLRTLPLPRMTAIERERCARLEADRAADFGSEPTIVRIHAIAGQSNAWALGIARAAAVRSRIAAVQNARLKVLAVDHDACALLRVLPEFDAVLDVGHRRASLHVRTAHTPLTLQAQSGGADVTRAMERELVIDSHAAEKRKRILGTAGAGERARDALTAEIAALIERGRRARVIGRIALVGNGSRLPGLGAALGGASGAHVASPIPKPLSAGAYAEDVVRSGAPDWTLASALASWRSP